LRVSIIVVNWNRRELLRSCLKSLENQTLQEFEIIVVDNGSSDGSVEMLEREYSHIRLIRNAENRGF
jgi:glycosyltransferase involved in cell wall biosynthesis